MAEPRSITFKSIPFGGIEIDNLSLTEARGVIKQMIKTNRPGYVVTPNAHHLYMLKKDPGLKKAYRNAALILPDGMSVILALRLLGYKSKERCAGADLFQSAIDAAARNSKKIFILGGINHSEKKAEIRLRAEYPGIHVFTYSPPFGFENDEDETGRIIRMINQFRSDVLFLCVGCPKSEKWIYQNRSRIKPCLALAFGDSLNFFTGDKKRAPVIIQKTGFEWLFRFLQEPGRLWKRYLIGNLYFIKLFFTELLKKPFFSAKR
jgi:N-acetylglucosaminyldiphosphoundecaprenol N-acetyl-beta-D-mannosaminyltransferase